MGEPARWLQHNNVRLKAGRDYSIPMDPQPGRMFNTQGLARILRFHTPSHVTWRWVGQSKQYCTTLDDFVRMITTGRMPSQKDFK